MWDDIEKVPVFRNLPAIVENKAPETVDRFGAALFFVQRASMYRVDREVDKEAPRYRQRGEAYYYYAAMTALCGTEDSFNLDTAALGIFKKWDTKAAKLPARRDPLLGTLWELRNYSVHFRVMPNRSDTFKAVWGGKEMEFPDSTFFEPLSWTAVSELRNIQSGRSELTPDMLNWFNHQAAKWPAGNLLGEAGRRYGEFFGNFLQANT